MEKALFIQWSCFGVIRQRWFINWCFVLLFLLFWFIIVFSVSGQTTSIDDLQKELSSAPQAEKAGLLNSLARLYFNEDIDIAKEHAELALRNAEKYGDALQIAYAYQILGEVKVVQNDYSMAITYYSNSIDNIRNTNENDLLAQLHSDIGYVYERQGDYNFALDCYKKALKLGEEQNSHNLMAISYNNMGKIYQVWGQYQYAEEYYNNALKLYMELDDNKGKGDAYNNIGILYYYKGAFNTAIDQFITSLKYKEETGDSLSIARTMNNIAAIYYQMQSYDMALEYYNKSIDVYYSLNNQTAIAELYNNIGLVYIDIEDYSSALQMYNKALQIFEKTGGRRGTASAMLNAGIAHMELKDYYMAGEMFQNALMLFKEIDYKSEIVLARKFLGDINMQLRKFDIALEHFKLGLELAEELKMQKQVYEIHRIMAELFILKGDSHNALYHLKEYEYVRNEVFNREMNSEIEEIRERYEVEKKEQEIEILSQEKEISALSLARQTIITYSIFFVLILVVFIAILVFKRYRLKQMHQRLALEFKSSDIEHRLLRAQLNPHAICNSLNTIQQFISSSDIKNADAYLGRFSRMFRHILETSRKSYVTLEEEVESLQSYLDLEKEHMKGNLDYLINIDENIDTGDFEIPIMLIQPFVENAIIHGVKPLKEKGIIKIDFRLNDDKLICNIEDNGVGREKAESEKNKRNIKHNSVGTKIINERLELLRKIDKLKIEINTTDLYSDKNQACGTTVEIIIPVL